MTFLKVLGFVAAMIFTGSVAHADLSSTLRACIAASGDDFSKARTDGTSDTIVMVVCDGATAQSLWEALKFYAREGGVSEDDRHNQRISRYFGNLRTPSQCVRFFQDGSGRSTNTYQCFIALDLSGAVVKAM